MAKLSTKGIGSNQEGLEKEGGFDLQATGPALRIVMQDGRNPSSKNIDIGSLRTTHPRSDQGNSGHPDTISPNIGKTNQGPSFK